MKTNKQKKQQGFTLIELMIVVAVIGVLAAIAIPQYQNYVKKSEAAAGLATLRSLTTNIDTFIADTGTFPADGDAPTLGAAVDMNKLGTISFADSGASGATATFTFDGTASALASTDTVVLAKDATTGLWTCSHSTGVTLKGC
ncbi:pilin [Vibrio alginolyticus]|jgi:type IV pilus assembly protein PilA|uniref:type IV pilin protein n=1 Tax=Vibrio TaxID=662 RepID=UPI000682E195|nr:MULTISPECIES: pilin [Vibrio]EGQ9179116.1 pilin [Vibrio alginolyticus]ELA6792013.1 pilin [Vibrio alginolyticus]ELA8375466.1 pilin [Vibrio alginolyticus]ELB2813730.1 pilin [Vibrio alginolyticus]MCS0221899.1 pilin [Vibrio alginolyticus]